MAAIRIRVGASLDRSVDAVFSAVEKRAQRSQRTIARGFQGGSGLGSSGGGPYRTAARDADRAAREIERSQKRAAREAERAHQAASRKIAKGFEQIGRAAASASRQQIAEQRRAERETSRMRQRQREIFARRTSFGTLQGARAVGRVGARVAGDIIRGVGVDTSLSGSVGRAVQLQRAAVALSNQGFQMGAQGAAGVRVPASQLISEARTMGDTLGVDPAEVMAAQQAFVDLTGNLESARASMGFLGKLSVATGTNMIDMAEAAANVDNQLADTPDKAQRLATIMKTIAGQGKLGAVEIKDLATQMARIASAAPSFAGDVDTNVQKLGALAQLSRAMGGSPSAAEAARSVVGFSSTLQKGARIKAFRKAGVNVFADEAQTKFKDPFALIKESLLATGGDLEEMNKLFMDVVGARAVRGLSSKFSAAGGGQQGIAAVQAEFDRFTKGAALSDKAIEDAFTESQKTAAAKAQKFQNQLDRVIESMASKVLPALEKLAPTALEVTEAFAGIVTFVSKNLGLSITAALSASLAKAGLAAAARGAIERAIMGSGPGGAKYSRAAGFGGGIGVAGNAAAALSIATAAVTIASVGMLTIQSLADADAERDRKNVEGEIEVSNIENAARDKTLTSGQGKRAEAALEAERQRLAGIQRAKAYATNPLLATEDLLSGKSPSAMIQGVLGAVKGDQGDTEERIGRLENVMRGIKDGTLRVIVTNADEINANKPSVDPSGRGAPPVGPVP